jgi:DNA repair exonuclease SbcCD nuclease subunit
MADVFKFLHASDLHLDRPITGLSEIPGHLKATLANAPYEAAQKFFDAAIAENVDFVLLAGDVTCMDRGGPRTAAFLLNQFERLADKDIFVYWCAGEIDHPDRWPASIELPDNVVTFSSSVVERVSHRKHGVEIATIFGIGFDGKKRVSGEFRAEETDPFPIALSYGELENSNLTLHQIRYWALGGKHRRKVNDKASTMVVYPGTSQGRNLEETGSYSCTLGRVDQDGSLKMHEIDVDRVRWLPQTVAVAENIKLDDLKNVLADRALKVATESSDKLVLVNWHLTTTGDFNPRIRQEAWRKEVLKWLRDELGQDSERGIWSVDLTVQPPKSLPSSWYEEDTILGDYLRSVARYHADESIQLGLHEYTPAAIQDDSLATIGRVTKERRAEILREAAMVGVEYLSQHDIETSDED